ncbi:hypothetical protein P170DRAFT_199167 [Aspergillus steynii IBT 23096]|uniref:Uncharacterized protein n=1 Tax=Aspergillus steynii IBT 23096 TaxID=1392250 RepID=A0A2I2G4S6_9EURO|nr:uncharacterized protein P170DRAFT_199167 [Aspergillus steynii IBT 23096]PLB47878.1 hypothetical protein P170DRAFT_199167 [Aspergillus steynii IBT 23096]
MKSVRMAVEWSFDPHPRKGRAFCRSLGFLADFHCPLGNRVMVGSFPTVKAQNSPEKKNRPVMSSLHSIPTMQGFTCQLDCVDAGTATTAAARSMQTSDSGHSPVTVTLSDLTWRRSQSQRKCLFIAVQHGGGWSHGDAYWNGSNHSSSGGTHSAVSLNMGGLKLGSSGRTNRRFENAWMLRLESQSEPGTRSIPWDGSVDGSGERFD